MPPRERTVPSAPAAPAARLRLDTERMYAAHGVSAAELIALQPRLVRAHADVVAKSRAGLEAEFACLTLPTRMPALLPAIEQAAAELRRFRDVVVAGIGGSSLGAKAIYYALREIDPPAERPVLHFLENIDPSHLHALLARLRPENTAVVTISKSGNTLETVVQFLALREWLERRLGATDARKHQWVVTDPAHGWLRALAEREQLPVLELPPAVGGRYSVLTAVGLLPLAAAGVDARALLAGAGANAARCTRDDLRDNPALELAALYYLLDARHGKRVSIMMPYANPLREFVNWYCQLWAESLGKRGPDGEPAGTLPVRAMGSVDQHSQLQMYLESRADKMFTFLVLDRWEHDRAVALPDDEHGVFPYLAGRRWSEVLDAEFRATRDVITHAGHPNLSIHLPALHAHALGELIDLYQRVTIYAGLLYGINPLDQPAVERGKQLTLRYLGAPGAR
jgi:glucose-6-phosphate isomerase